jgi:Pentapeptide repeats (8 copies)
MANEEQLSILKQGVEVWNKWIWENRPAYIDLRGSDFKGANLQDFDFERADLSESNLRGANLGAASLRRANLYKAYLTDADSTVPMSEGPVSVKLTSIWLISTKPISGVLISVKQILTEPIFGKRISQRVYGRQQQSSSRFSRM